MPESSALPPAPPPVNRDSLVATSRPWALTAVSLTLVMAALESTVIATAMPVIVGDLGGFELFSWVFSVFLLAQAITIPTYGRLADLFGRKRILFLGIGLFLVGSVLCGCAWNMASLIAFRAVQGLGAGALIPVSMTIIGDIYTPAERAKIQGFLSSAWTLAALIGPLAGAALVGQGHWSLVFWFNVPLGLLTMGMLAATLRETVRRRSHHIDYIGTVLMVLGTGILMFAFTQAPTLSATTIAILAGTGVAALIAMLAYERRAIEPMMPPSLWRDSTIIGGTISGISMGVVLLGSSVFLSIYMQLVMGESVFIAGIVLGSVSFSWVIGSFAGGWLMLRLSYRAAVIAGGIPLLIGVLMLIVLEPARGWMWACTAGFIIGIGMGFSSNTFTIAAQSNVGRDMRGIATSHLALMRNMGYSVGAALFGGVLNAGVSGHLAGTGDVIDRLMDPALRANLSQAEIAPLTAALADALFNVFLIQGVFAVLMLLTAWFLPAGLSPRHQTATRP